MNTTAQLFIFYSNVFMCLGTGVELCGTYIGEFQFNVSVPLSALFNWLLCRTGLTLTPRRLA